MKLIQMFLLATLLAARPVPAADSAPGAEANYLRLSVDNVVIDTTGLESASLNLAGSIEALAQAIDRLSQADAGLGDAERQALLDAVRSVDAASLALAELAQTLPATARDMSAQLPRLVSNAREPIAEISLGLQSARDGIVAITESLPQATENAKALVNSALDAALWRLSLYSILLFALLALVLVGVMWFAYRQYLAPLAQRLEALAVAPEHFAAMAGHMQQTSENLLLLQQRGGALTQPPAPAVETTGADASETPPDADENRARNQD